jgi:hypothetical protein
LNGREEIEGERKRDEKICGMLLREREREREMAGNRWQIRSG